MEFVIPLILIGLLWALVILPQQRRLKAHKAFVESVQAGDDVITTAGVYGTVRAIDGDRARLEIAPDVEITVSRYALGERQVPDQPVDDAVADAGDDDTATPTDPTADSESAPE